MALRLLETETATRPVSTSDPGVFLFPHQSEKWNEMRERLKEIGEMDTDSDDFEDKSREFVVSIFQDWLCDENGEPPEPEEVTEEVVLALPRYTLMAYLRLFSDTLSSLGKPNGPPKTRAASSRRGSTRKVGSRASRASRKKS